MPHSRFTINDPGDLRLYSLAELLMLPPPQWLIENIIPKGAFVGFYGPPGSYKSFVAVDIAMAVAAGRSWHGNPVERGSVVYVAAEGGTGIGKRMKAWLQHYNIKPNRVDLSILVEPFVVGRNSDQVARFIERIDEAERHPALVIVDTLASCFDGDESETGAMTEFVAGVDMLRTEYGCTTLVVHHTRLDGTRERGNTAFRGGADTMFSTLRAQNSPEVLIECQKQKDAEPFANIPLLWQPVDGTESGLLVGPDDERDTRIVEMIEVLRKNGPMTWTEWFSSTTIPKTTFHRYYMELKKEGKILKKNELWSVRPSS